MDLSQLDPEERERWTFYALNGLHTFLFVDHLEGGRTLREVIDILQDGLPTAETSREDPAILAASEFVGGHHQAFVHLWAPDGQLALMQDLIAGPIWDLGCRCEYATQATSFQGDGTVHTLKIKKCDVVAVSKLWVEPGTAMQVLPVLAELDGFDGAATVFGSFDVLLVLGATEYETVARTVLHDLHGIPGVIRSETSYADFRRYPKLYDGEEAKAAKKAGKAREQALTGLRSRLGLSGGDA
jgi:hypothetical protein